MQVSYHFAPRTRQALKPVLGLFLVVLWSAVVVSRTMMTANCIALRRSSHRDK
jgi:hypothetical protein